jgi:hypothetical protein
MQLKRKSHAKMILVVALAAVLFCVGGFFVYKQFFTDEQARTDVQDIETLTKNDTGGDASSNAMDFDTNNKPSDGFAEDKTPAQYEGQTDNSATHGDYNNEQFRIPEGE